ncbi:MAG: hypothetical protein IJJ50_01785 [Lachnospiraceae bacterium]|nr:hypothetical protein [Lachnospiraceae bacterium]
MSFLVACRERLQSFYGQFSGILNVCGKFLLAVFVFLLINREIGYNPLFSNMFVILIMALIASIMSSKALVLLAAVVIMGNSYSLGIEILIFTALLLLLLYIMFVSFVPDDAIEAILMPISITAGIPALIPVCCGLKRNPGCIAALWPGIVVHYYIHALGDNAAALGAIEKTEYTDRLKVILDAMLENHNIVVSIFSAAAVVIIVYAIRKLQADYTYEISVLAGGIMFIVMSLVSNSTLGLKMDLTRMIVGTLIAVVFAYVFLFFIHHVDYAKTEHLTFEDDEYFYYVKAIPKIISEDWEDEEDEEEEEDEPDAPVVEQAALFAALQEAAKDVALPEEGEKTEDVSAQ